VFFADFSVVCRFRFWTLQQLSLQVLRQHVASAQRGAEIASAQSQLAAATLLDARLCYMSQKCDKLERLSRCAATCCCIAGKSCAITHMLNIRKGDYSPFPAHVGLLLRACIGLRDV
jgi:hypothetical protein